MGGTSLGSWILQNSTGAFGMLVGISIFSLTLPLLLYLPTKGNSPKVGFRALEGGVSSSSYDMEYEEVAQEDSQSRASKIHPEGVKINVMDSCKTLINLLLHHGSFRICLSILFLNTIALESRILLKQWMSTRYSWTLAQTGYILSIESILSILVLLVLQYISSTSSPNCHGELVISKVSILCQIFGSLILFAANEKALFILGAVVISGGVGFLDSITAHFTSELERSEIGLLYSMINVVDTLATIVSSPIWSMVYRIGYNWGSIWIGVPFLACTVVFLAVLGLTMLVKNRNLE